MPLLKVYTSVVPPAEKRDQLLAMLSKCMTEATRKPEQYVMVTLDTVSMMMSGKPGPAAFVDVRGIGGLNPSVNKQIAQKVCALLSQSLGIPTKRIYLNFTDVSASHWGWNGDTFG